MMREVGSRVGESWQAPGGCCPPNVGWTNIANALDVNPATARLAGQSGALTATFVTFRMRAKYDDVSERRELREQADSHLELIGDSFKGTQEVEHLLTIR